MMKKITLLLIALMCFTFGQSQSLPFDFEGTTYTFGTTDGATITNGTGNDVLEIVGAAAQDWDRAVITFGTPIDLSNAAENTIRFTFQSTSALVGEEHQHGLSFQGGGGAVEMNFVTIGQTPVDVELNFEAGITTRNEMHIFTDVKNFGVQSGTGGSVITPGDGGTGGTSSLSGTYIIDNITLGFDPGTCSDGVLNNGEEAIDCGGPNCAPCAADMTPPTSFTAVLGTVGGTSVELLLNATDDSGGDITYDVTYDGGGTAQTIGASGVETSLVITGLTPETMYTFMVSASDVAGNPAANNAIPIPATTIANIALPFDFEGTVHGFTGDGGPGVTNGAGMDVLEITAGVADWDNTQVTFTDQIDLSDEFNNTLRFTIQSTTAAAGEVRQHGVSFQGGGAALEANFQTVGTEVLNVELNFNAGLGSRDKLVIFTDVGDLGGIAATPNVNGMNTAGLSGTYIIDNMSLGADPETCDDGIMNNGETDIDCGGPNCDSCDVTAPTAFTATAGTVSAFSVELLLNATDAGSDITYDVTYDGGGTAQIMGASGVETPLVISGLTSETMYTFMVSASDASGNPAANNAITVMATTGVDSSTDCAGFSAEAVEGIFSVGYNFSFVTEASGTDVTINFEILDTDKTGLVGQVFIEPSTFIDMTNTGGLNFTTTLTGQVNGDVISFSGRFPYAGGLVRTKVFSYTVGDDCSTLGTTDFDLAAFSVYPNPSQNSWTVKTQNAEMSSIKVYDILGKNVLSLSPNKTETVIDASNLKTGLYFAQITTEKGVNSIKLIKN